MEATMFRAWAVYYTSVTCRPDTPVMRARTRAFFSQRVGNFWGAGEENTLLHLSVLLFIIGGLIYVFNINRSIFYAVVWWFGFLAVGYADMSTRVFLYPRSLFRTPLSLPALRIYLGISYVVFQIRSHISSLCGSHNNMGWRHRNLSNHYRDGISVGKLREAKEIASKPSSNIDSQILERILLTLDDDRALEPFFDAIPGFCNSKLSVLPLSLPVQRNLRQALDGFLDRTFSSSLISESVRTGRLITCLNAAHAALEPHAISAIFDKIFNGRWDEALKSVEIGHALRLWGHSQEYDKNIRQILALIIARVRGRDDRWILLVKETFGVPDRVLQDYLAHGDNVLLPILIHVSRQATNRAGSWTSGILTSLSAFDIHDTLPELQHDFCALWNETAQEARNQGSSSTPVNVLREIRHLYIALHQGTDAAPTAFSTSTDSLHSIMDQPSSYPLCDIASHHSGSTAHVQVPVASGTVPPPTQPGDSPAYASPHRSTLDYSTALLAEETNMITGLPSPPDPPTASETRETSQAPTAPFPVHSTSPSSDGSPQDGVAAVASAQAGTTLAAKSSLPPESDKQQGLATLCAAPAAPPAGISGIVSTVPTPAPVPTFTPPVLNKFSALDSPPPPHVPPFPNEELLSLRSGMSPEDPSGNATLPRLRPRMLVNNGNMCLANAVLQLLVYCPPFRDLFRDLGRLVGQREGGEVTGGSVTPLIDASVKFLDEFVNKETSPVAGQFLQQAGGSKVEGEKEDNSVHSFLSTDVYVAMKEKRQFIIMGVRSCAHVVAFCC
jgi:hypothetical protein